MELHGLVQSLMLGSLAVVAFSMANLLPSSEHLHAAMLEDPLQKPTLDKPFGASVKGFEYRVTLCFTYSLHGLVVSLHDSEASRD